MHKDRFSIAVVVVLLVCSPVFAPIATAQPDSACNGAEKNTVVKKSPGVEYHIEYTFQFSPETNQYCVLVENKGEGETLSGFDASVDGRTAAPEMPTLAAGESKYVEKNVTDQLDVLRDNHTVTLGIFNDTFVYNFTRELNATNPDVPAPTIRDVEVIRHEENDSTSVRIVVHNPTKRGYNIYVQAKTFGTRRVDDIGAPQPNKTSVFTLPLKEGTDVVVGGKVRVFDNWGEPNSRFDQKEFLSRPGNDTEMWDKPFETMPGTDSAASYNNETSKQYRANYVDDDYLSEQERKIGAVTAVVLLVAVAWWRRR